MAVVVEYIILLTGLISYGGKRIGKIHITHTAFILFDESGSELFVARRIGGSTSVVSGFIPYLSFGTVLRFLVDEKRLFAISDDSGTQEIECTVVIPE